MPAKTAWFSAIAAVGWIEGRRGIGESAAVAELVAAIDTKRVGARGWQPLWWNFAQAGIRPMTASAVFGGVDVARVDLEREWPAADAGATTRAKRPAPLGKDRQMQDQLRRLIAGGVHYPSQKAAWTATLSALGVRPEQRGFGYASFRRACGDQFR